MPVRSTCRDHDDPLNVLLMDAARGDLDAFTEYCSDVGQLIYSITLKIIGDHHQAEDVAQETLIEAWRTSGRFDPSRGSARQWTAAIAHHRAVDRVRSSDAARRRESSWLGNRWG